MVVRGIGVGGGVLHVAQRDPGVQTAAVNERARSVCGPTGLMIPARRAARRTIRAAPCRSRRASTRPCHLASGGPCAHLRRTSLAVTFWSRRTSSRHKGIRSARRTRRADLASIRSDTAYRRTLQTVPPSLRSRPCWPGGRGADAQPADGDAEAEAVTATANLGDEVGGEHGRDHLGSELSGELVGDPVPRCAARVRYLGSDRERLIRHLRRLLAGNVLAPR